MSESVVALCLRHVQRSLMTGGPSAVFLCNEDGRELMGLIIDLLCNRGVDFNSRPSAMLRIAGVSLLSDFCAEHTLNQSCCTGRKDLFSLLALMRSYDNTSVMEIEAANRALDVMTRNHRENQMKLLEIEATIITTSLRCTTNERGATSDPPSFFSTRRTRNEVEQMQIDTQTGGYLNDCDQTTTAQLVHQNNIGSRVTLCGLESKPELNGRQGIIMAFVTRSWRYSVAVGTDEKHRTYNIRPRNILLPEKNLGATTEREVRTDYPDNSNSGHIDETEEMKHEASLESNYLEDSTKNKDDNTWEIYCKSLHKTTRSECFNGLPDTMRRQNKIPDAEVTAVEDSKNSAGVYEGKFPATGLLPDAKNNRCRYQGSAGNDKRPRSAPRVRISTIPARGYTANKQKNTTKTPSALNTSICNGDLKRRMMLEEAYRPSSAPRIRRRRPTTAAPPTLVNGVNERKTNRISPTASGKLPVETVTVTAGSPVRSNNFYRGDEGQCQHMERQRNKTWLRRGGTIVENLNDDDFVDVSSKKSRRAMRINRAKTANATTRNSSARSATLRRDRAPYHGRVFRHTDAAREHRQKGPTAAAGSPYAYARTKRSPPQFFRM